ncbi:unnamed protein product [Ostreobium quekettii]|uniref:Alpha-type protein kinase domain-containing protein n=1 Tax=Ostreobium quekettii TaxID=121088 RepID=A0A8S1IY79_9CHLO|nr:unnamed protein product [Ostreobium quekettii]
MDFQWAVAVRLKPVAPAESARGLHDSMHAFAEEGFAVRRQPDWGAMHAERGVVVSYEAPRSITSLVMGTGRGARSQRVSPVKVAPLPFARRGEQATFFAVDMDGGEKDAPPAVQAFKSFAGALSVCEHKAELYATASFLMSSFQQKVLTTGLKAEQVTVPAVQMVNMIERDSPFHGVLVPLELEEKEPLCFSADSSSEREREAAAFLEAFTHWTHHRTNGELMVVANKGARAREGGFLVADPEIYCKDLRRFGPTNKGTEGMNGFLKSHVCSHLCDRLMAEQPQKRERRRSLSRSSKAQSILTHRSLKDSAKAWSPCSPQSVKEVDHIDTGLVDWLSPRAVKPVKCEWVPIWRALKRNRKV